MRIVTVSMVRNEEVFVESSIRYWLTFADTVIVFDHHSTDGTGRILQVLKEELGKRLELYQPGTQIGLEKMQAQITNEMIACAFEAYEADLVMPLDADEFPYMRQPGASLRDYLSALSQDCCYGTYWMPFAPPDGELDLSQLAPLSFTQRRKEPLSNWRKVILTGKCYREDSLMVQMGNHQLTRPSGEALPEIKQLEKDMCYAHYPYRGLEHALVKNTCGWISNLIRSDWKQKESKHYHRGCEMILEGRMNRDALLWLSLTSNGLTEEDEQEVLQNVVTVDPGTMYPSIPLVYTQTYAAEKGAFASLTQYAISLAHQYREKDRRCRSLEEKIPLLQQSLAQKKEQLAMLGAKKDYIDDLRKALRKTVDKRDAALAALSEQKKELEANCEKLKAQLDLYTEAAAKEKEAELRLDALMKENSALKQQLQTLQQQPEKGLVRILKKAWRRGRG